MTTYHKILELLGTADRALKGNPFDLNQQLSE